MNSNKSQIATTILVLLVLLVTVVRGQESTNVSVSTPALLQYQGRLTDPTSGEALPDGSYTMVFRLYDTATGGKALWTEVKDVPVKGGLFSTVLGATEPLDLHLFNGRALWLGIKIGTDQEMVPRQQVLPVAYALSLVPGAAVEGSSGAATLTLSNSGSGPALEAQGPVQVSGDLTVDGQLSGGAHTHSGNDIVSDQVADARIPGTIARDSEVTSAITGHAANAEAHHVRYTDEEAIYVAQNFAGLTSSTDFHRHTDDTVIHHEPYTNAKAWSAITTFDGSGSGLDADKLDGQQASSFASSTHGHAALPIAYGEISAEGDKLSGTDNFTSRRISIAPVPGGQYEISIAGHCYSNDYVTLVTSSYLWDVSALATYGDCKLLVRFHDDTEYRFTHFQFVTFKIN